MPFQKPSGESAGQSYLRHYLRQAFFVEADPDHPNALRDGIDVVAVDNTANWWPRNPLAEIFHFRGVEVDKLQWRDHIHFMDTPFDELHSETDNSDVQGTIYFVKRFKSGEIACVVRIHPSIDKYGRDISMIGLNLPHLVDDTQTFETLLRPDFIETSRVIINDERLPSKLPDGSKNPDRRKAALDCLASSVLFSHMQGYKGFFCFMPTKIWEVTYKAMGLDVYRLGDNKQMKDLPDSQPYDVYAGYMNFSDEVAAEIRERVGISEKDFFYGTSPESAMQMIVTMAGSNPPHYESSKSAIERVVPA